MHLESVTTRVAQSPLWTPSSRQQSVRFQAGSRMQRPQVTSAAGSTVRRPILLIDIMDTVVRDPFYEHMPAFFGMTFQELMEAKHPESWVKFELGHISEQDLYDNFWRPGAAGVPFDGAALREHMASRYSLLPGMAELLQRLAAAGYELHACSNYPTWWREVEARLRLGDLLPWTFLSCEGPMRGLRKPDPAAFQAAALHLGVLPADLLLVDDREVNAQAARGHGMRAVRFVDTGRLEEELQAAGLEF
uniref:Uncharacterized protein n=3 Tax=Auxenochlorella protothecoides TaxID=3075 RepID=A0A1D1ZW68_AUXPR